MKVLHFGGRLTKSGSPALLENTTEEFIELKRRRERKTPARALKKISAHKADYLSTPHSQPVDRKVSTQQVAAVLIQRLQMPLGRTQASRSGTMCLLPRTICFSRPVSLSASKSSPPPFAHALGPRSSKHPSLRGSGLLWEHLCSPPPWMYPRGLFLVDKP